MTKTHLDRIDSVRGLAILLVFSFHTLLLIVPGFEIKKYTANGIIEVESWKSLLLSYNPFGQGWIGVDLFLVISGFLIHLIHLRSGTRLNIALFFSKRFWRIFPPYLFVLLFFFFMQADTSPQGLKHLFSHVFLVHNLHDTTFFSINPSFWSIALECQLYLIYPLYLLLLKYLGANRTLLVIVTLNIVLTTIGLIAGISSLSYGTFVLKMWIVWCAGAFLADRYYNNKRVFGNPALWFLISYLVFCLFKSWYLSSKFILLPATVSCMALMELLIYYKDTNGVIVKAVFKPLAFIGLCSYSIYLIHQPYLGNLLSFYNPRTAFDFFNSLVSAGLAGVTILVISYVLYKTLELRSIALGQRIRGTQQIKPSEST